MLYELIQTMSRTEKRYFRMGASFVYEKGSQELMKIFDMVSEQKIRDEKEIKSRLEASILLRRKNFSLKK